MAQIFKVKHRMHNCSLISLFGFFGLDGLFHKSDKVGSLGDDAEVVHLGVAGVVVHLDVGHVGRLLDSLDLPHIAAVAEYVGILAYRLGVTLEVHNVHLVVPDQCLEQADVTQSVGVSTQELLVCKVLVKLLHVLGVTIDGLIVRFL